MLLTGISGFIGKNLAPKLRDEGYTVYGLVRPTSSNAGIFTQKNVVSGDILDVDSLTRVLEKVQPEVIVHLAALTPVRLSWLQPIKYRMVNTMGTVNLMETAIRVLGQRVFRFVYASSAEVYGFQGGDTPLKETVKLNPNSPYADSKLMSEIALRSRAWNGAFDLTVMRCNNTFGRPRSGYFVETMMEQMLDDNYLRGLLAQTYSLSNDGELTLTDQTASETPVKVSLYNPKHIRDYMFIEDHIEAYRHIIVNELVGTYNVAQGDPIRNVDMVKLMAEVLGYEVEVVEKEPEFPRPNDPPALCLDTTRLFCTGWRIKYTREEGIRALRRMYK